MLSPSETRMQPVTGAHASVLRWSVLSGPVLACAQPLRYDLRSRDDSTGLHLVHSSSG